jgi:hypothetical protein
MTAKEMPSDRFLSKDEVRADIAEVVAQEELWLPDLADEKPTNLFDPTTQRETTPAIAEEQSIYQHR